MQDAWIQEAGEGNVMFVKVALNLPINKLFTYSVPTHLESSVAFGKRVLVNFGKRTLTGVLTETSEISEIERTRPIKSILDVEPVIDNKMYKFGEWMATYYACSIGEVLFSAIPRNINVKSETYYKLTGDYLEKLDKFKKENDIYIAIISTLEKRSDEFLTSNQIAKSVKSDSVEPYLKNLTDTGIIAKQILFNKPTSGKYTKIISLTFDHENLNEVISENKLRSDKQKSVLEILSNIDEITKKELMDSSGISSSSLSSLELKGLIKVRQVRDYRIFREGFKEVQNKVELNDEQKFARDSILKSVKKDEFKTFLLHGITGSGKTEVYLNVIKEVLEKDKPAIVLVPEISLTPQLINRFASRFGELVGVIHSKLSDGEKLDTFDSIRNGNIKIIIGARSALFAPFEDLGIIIVDEEHDHSYKQENSPRYHARDAAIMRGKIYGCPVVLGSGTPSVESYYNAISGKYELLKLTKRATKITPPEIKIIDLKKQEREELEEFVQSQSNRVQKDFFDFINKVRLKFLSKELIVEIDERLDKMESIILLQNRRGFHSYTECLSCSNVESCPRCSISLTYHKSFEQLKCHFCGYSRKYDGTCSVCGSNRLIPKGAGTERVEEEIAQLFPNARVERMDSDSVSSKKKFNTILQEFYDGKIDILAGTQMISKGLDFPNVTLVGVVNADIGLLNPDFRATEKTFQILTQVAGRSGRSKKLGEVVVQTNHAEYDVFTHVKEHDYEGFFNKEIAFRKSCNYPPFSRLVLIEIKSDDRLLTESKIKEIFNFIKKIDKEQIAEMLPPNPPLFSKLKDKFRYHLLIKCSKQKDPSGFKMNRILKQVRDYADKSFPSKVQLIFDVDAVSLL